MNGPSVAQFISDKRTLGLSDSEIAHLLLDAGWHMDIIHKAMHGEPIRSRNLDPILDIKKQPLRKILICCLVLILLLALALLAIFI